MGDHQLPQQGGRETSFGSKQGSKEQPLISIITSTFNAEKDLHWTIDSIRAQTYPNIQWIVADGGSKDGTVDLLKQNEDVIDFWFSEADKGIYDAWNKALKHAKGEWIQFIGAGDELADELVFEKVSKHLSTAFPTYELVYGSIDIISEENRVFIERIGTPWEDMKDKWFGIRPALPMHPEVFHHRSIFEDLDFTKFKIVGDSYIVLNSVLRKEPMYLDILIDRMPLGGVSTNPKNIINMYLELKLINKRLSINPPFKNKALEFFKVYVKYFIMRFIGKAAFNFLGDFYRRLLNKPSKWLVK
ncbi:glycosyltransferase family 2 protein [Marinomonas polaris]|uniref:glycosyltransferase family 2 protein n=1 Tax=Marinomonas polaris TaxID=293552 RepID=UPI003517D387